jgi:mevalonate kinase
MTTTYSVPAKTFLVGEYVALDGGPSILLNTEPRFELVLQAANLGGPSVAAPAFANASPAGRYLAKHPDCFDGQEAEFRDPFVGKGGLGASSAQFILTCAAHKNWTSIDPHTFDWGEFLREYRSCAWSGAGVPPSGADVVSQMTGGVTYFDGRGMTAGRLEWTFPNLTFTLFRTGTKVPTHEHLKQLNDVPVEALRLLVADAKRAIESANEKLLVDTIDAVAMVLSDAKLTTERTASLLRGMKAKDGLFLAAKGCGALGAGVIVAIHESDKDEDVEIWAQQDNLEICGTFDRLSEGLKVTST